MKVAELQELASSLGIAGASKRRKGELVELISAHTDGTAAVEADDVVEPAPAAPSEAEAPAAASAPPVDEVAAEAPVAEAPAAE
ncbi:transcription termination factor Rho, partial [Agromyces binzhouensis]